MVKSDSQHRALRLLQSYNLEERGYYIGGQWMPGFSEGGLVSKDISWYSVKDMNIGIDFGSLNNRLSVLSTISAKVTTGYLASFQRELYSAVGYSSSVCKDQR